VKQLCIETVSVDW